MQFFRRRRSRSVVRNVALVVAAALVLSSCGAARSVPSITHHHVTPVATANIPASSVCGSEGDDVQQSFNGDFTGCIRVPALYSPSLIVALQAYIDGPSPPSGPTTTTTKATTTNDHLSLTLSSYNVKPGETVTITGHYSKPVPPPRQSFVNVCWDGCLTGLQDGGSQLRWTSHTSFHTTFQVPQTAWLVTNHGVVAVHPLRSGKYQVGVQCIGAISGCAYDRANAQATVTLKSSAPQRCVTDKPCETLHLSATTAKVGNTIKVTGWAPLQSVIGRPFGWDYSVTAGSLKRKYPALTYEQNQKGGGYNVVMKPQVLHVAPSPTWASLGHVPYISSTFAGPSSVEALNNSDLIAWCQTSGLRITGGSSPVEISTSGVATALRGTPLRLFSGSPGDPPCSTVLLDPTYHDTIYAGFNTAVNHSAPPIYIAGLYTTDNGATWHTVPTPTGTNVEDFSGFTTDGDQVEALFAGVDTYNSRQYPLGTHEGLVSAEVTSNGGASWTATTLGCPASGPCTVFGPYEWGNCAMNGSPQPLLQGPTGSTAMSGVRWTNTSWAPSLNSCFSQQLVVSSQRDLLLLDTSSQYPLQESTDAGQTWSYVALPRIAAANYNGQYTPLGNSLLFAPDGSLFAAVAPPSSKFEDLFLLSPGATSWCEVPHVFRGTISNANLGPLRIAGADLVWTESTYPNDAPETLSEHEVALSSLRC